MILSLAAMALATQLSGRILLAVEDAGRAWYVNPVDQRRYSLGSPDDAWDLMRSLALGISNADLARPIPQRLAGRILLAVEDHGKAYYVHPLTLQLYYLGRPADAFRVMTDFGLGITNADLARIPSATLSNPLTPSMVQSVPFTPQAPFGEWLDPRQQEGCEEASVFMAVKWARGESFTLQEAKEAIIGMSEWEDQTFLTYFDTSADDTADRLMRQYMGYGNFSVVKNIDIHDIKDSLARGHIVIVPVNGKKLGNPNYQSGGPLRHMIVVTGYDSAADTFVTNDPGTRTGAGYRYSASVLDAALMDYPSGDHVPLSDLPTAMIAVSR